MFSLYSWCGCASVRVELPFSASQASVPHIPTNHTGREQETAVDLRMGPGMVFFDASLSLLPPTQTISALSMTLNKTMINGQNLALFADHITMDLYDVQTSGSGRTNTDGVRQLGVPVILSTRQLNLSAYGSSLVELTMAPYKRKDASTLPRIFDAAGYDGSSIILNIQGKFNGTVESTSENGTATIIDQTGGKRHVKLDTAELHWQKGEAGNTTTGGPDDAKVQVQGDGQASIVFV